ncbi:MAG: NAD(P)/FAD-dependent oxidoreductase [Planctomycetia bacterium]|nr:NAD(P)/FAD-dependent oxidoreductase [Planctomycetia bacterium]
MNTTDVIVVGAGPAGLLAACRASERGYHTLLLERNPKPGAKILISGGGHCNLTHATDARGIVEAFGPSGRFLHSAMAALDPQGLVDLLAAEGVATRTEPDGKILPASDRAGDVLAALMRRLRRGGATLAVGESLVDLRRDDAGFRLTTSRRTLAAAKVVLSTGGQSYPACGTTGDGYRWAAALGHSIVPPRPALVPIVTDEDWVKQLQGITIADVLLRVLPAEDEPAPGDAIADRHEALAERRGSLLFAHFGLSGPVALDLSRFVSVCPRGKRPLLACDFLPDVTPSELDSILASGSARAGRRQIASLLDPWLPRRLAEALVARAQVDPGGRAAELSRDGRVRLVEAVKRLRIRATGTLGFEKAEVTAGGVSLEDVDSRTMQSRRVGGLYLAGELLDLDGPIGGYNLQAAFSTGYLAGDRL